VTQAEMQASEVLLNRYR